MTASCRCALAALLLASACLSPSPPPALRYFRPLPVPPQPVPPQPAPAADRVPLRLGPVSAAPYLRDRMVWRLSPVELAFDELHLWVTPPAQIVEEALARVLYGEAGFVRDDAASTSLEVHVSAFERETTHVTVALLAAVRTGDGIVHFDEIRATAPLAGEGPEAYAEAIGPALHEAAQGVAQLVRRALAG